MNKLTNLKRRKEILEEIIKLENKEPVNFKDLQTVFIEVMEKTFGDDFNDVLDFGIRFYGYRVGNIPLNIVNAIQLSGAIFSKVKCSSEQNKWRKFINNIKTKNEKIYLDYFDFFCSKD